MKKDKAQKPNLTWVKDEAFNPINEEHRKYLIKLWDGLEDMKKLKHDKIPIIYGTGGEIDK
jgi:hypothetical protein